MREGAPAWVGAAFTLVDCAMGVDGTMKNTFEMLMKPLARNELDTQIAVIPRQIVQSLEEDQERVGLTLTRAHVAVLDDYVAYVVTIPTQRQAFVQWLGYSQHSDPELAIYPMQVLFHRINLHADAWARAKQKSHQLPVALAGCARSISLTGERALLACERIKVLGGRREAWQGVQFEVPVPLNAQDRAIVMDMVSLLSNIKVSVNVFHFQVSEVRKEMDDFRDVARFELRASLLSKIEAINRTSGTTATMQMLRGRDNLGILAQRMRALIMRLEDVTTSASHLQTAWQFIETYLEASIARLGTLQDSRQLGVFVIHFKSFLAQWDFIEACALSLRSRLL
ncbi:hypothetical protein [Pseudomonas aegrilactucae]|uniref:Uncharacterized protein n=1 Tax=Pseudomonas aegrilactucae TaxID=2854028 RepID=A0A9Q2XH72_9PSED|nr:hypothetical protein [Pseudomonas aegrilactucae]MBV6286255.1 hypothetical protein [Pseudomonas aegrilactucae]